MYRYLRALSLCLPSATLIACTPAAAAQVTIEPSDPAGSRFKIVISGPINLATLVDFSRALVDPRIGGMHASMVELDSPGGSIPAAMAIGGFVRSSGLRTAVAHHRSCDSACALILAAGIERDAGFGSVSIHRPRYEASRSGAEATARARERYNQVLASMRDYLKRMGPGEKLLDAMLAVPNGRLKPLSLHELHAFGLSPPPRIKTRSLSGHAAGIRAHDASEVGIAREALRQAVAAGPPPGLWRVSARGWRIHTVSALPVPTHEGGTRHAHSHNRKPPFA